MTPLTIVLCRVGFASMILLAVVGFTGKKMSASAGIWGTFFALGALIVEQPWHPALLGLSAVSTSLAYIIYFRILAVAGATNILLVTFLIPASAIFLGVVVLGERPGWNAFGGMALIFLGLIAIDGRLVKGFRRQKNG